MADLVEVGGFQYKRTTAVKLGLIESGPDAASAEAGPSRDKLIRSAPQTGSPVKQEPNPGPTPVVPGPDQTKPDAGAAPGAQTDPDKGQEANPEQPAAQTAEVQTSTETVTTSEPSTPAAATAAKKAPAGKGK